MSKQFFWLTKAQFNKIKPHLPTDTRGVERVDDRRVISGIIHILKTGGRWVDAPRDQYGPHKTSSPPFNSQPCLLLGMSLGPKIKS